jgi:alcohol dehydrogenase, propanol-preferring
MRAAVLHRPGQALLLERDLPTPAPRANEILLKVHACGICRTDLHVIDGELPNPKLPLVLGHQIVGTIEGLGAGVSTLAVGDRVGVPWLAWTCGACRYCRRRLENLCERALFTGYTRDGGFADYAVADARFCLPLPNGYGDLEAAPLLCAGLIGYRALRLCGDAKRLGFYGFGAAAHILIQVAQASGQEVYAFTRPGDLKAQAFARELGAVWAGDSSSKPPVELDAAILFAPVGALVPQALAAVDKGGTVVAAGIHMSDIPSFPYRLLWEERSVRSVANLTRADGDEFLALVGKSRVHTSVQRYSLAQVNEALDDLRAGRLVGSAVIAVD